MIVTDDDNGTMTVHRQSFLNRHWPLFLGLGMGSIIYLRSRTNPGPVDVLIGIIGIALVGAGSIGLRASQTRVSEGAKESGPQTITFGEVSRKGVIRRAKGASLLQKVVALYVVSLVFTMLYVPTTVGQRWVWQLRKTVTTAAPSGDIFDRVGSPESIPVSEEVTLLPSYIVLHFAEVTAVALFILFIGYFRSEPVRSARKSTIRIVSRSAIAICGISLITPVLVVPCTYVVRSSYNARVLGIRSDYRWLWEVGEGNVKFSVLILEEVIVAAILTMIYLQYKRSNNS